MIYKYKTDKRSLKYFTNYQIPIELFKNLRDDNVKPRVELKNQNDFKSDQGEIRKGNPDAKSEEEISAIQKVENIFDLREKILDFL